MGHDPKEVHDIEMQLNNIHTSVFTDLEFPATIE
jgi:hypothetical protein